MSTKLQAHPLAVVGTILPVAASVFAAIYGGVVLSEAISPIVDPLAPSSAVNLARYAYSLTHLVVGIGLIAGAAMSLQGLRSGSNAALTAGQIAAAGAFCSMLAMQMLALWDLVPGA